MKTPGSRSLARQIAAIVLSAQIVCALLLSAADLFYEWRIRLHAFDVQLQGRSDSLLGAIQDVENPEDTVAVDPRELKLPGSDRYAVYDARGRLIGRSKGTPDTLITRKSDGFRTLRVDHESFRLIQREALRVIDRAETGGAGLSRPITIVYASPDGQLWHEAWEAARFHFSVIVIAAVLTVGLVLFLLRRALRPLAELTAEAGRLSMPALRFQTPPSVQKLRELQPLGQVLTDAVTSLRHSFEKEQRFFGDAAHELKTAVAVVRSSLQLLLLKERSGGEYREGLQRVLQDNSRTELLIAQMLRLATAEEVVNITTCIDLAQAVEESCGQLKPIAALRGVHLALRLEPGSLVHLLPEHAAAVASNLVLNAIQHSPAAATVEITVGRQGKGIVMEVRDRGKGIGTEALPHIFERFYREDVSRSRETGGTGLGLSICKTIVEAAGGSIQVRSERNFGTAFLVTFTQV